MKKILSFIVSMTILFSIGFTSTNALNSVIFSVDNFNYELTLQYNNSTNLSRYANRSLTYKFGKGKYKSYSFGSGWWSSTKLTN